MQVYSFKNVPGKKSSRKKFKLPGFFKHLKFNKKSFWTWVIRGAAIGVVAIALLFVYYTRYLPNPDQLLNRQIAESTKILDRNGQLLYEIHGEAKRTLVNLDQVPDYAQKATIAIEDKDFYNHHGLYFKGILRSVFRYIKNLGPSGGGGSTLTQQFVKNAILFNKSGFFGRKIPEAILSLEIEAKYSKDDILKFYLNEIPYGRNAYGIEAASETYFGKKAIDLSLAESAYLASLPQSPTRYNPSGPNRATLDARKDTVLTAMREQGYITESQEKQAKEEKVEFGKINTGLQAPYFSLMVQNYLADKFGENTLQEGGLKVYTTLDLSLQQKAETAVKEGVEKNITKYNGHNAALVAIDPKTGQVLAMVGGKDYFGDVDPPGCTPGKNCLFEPNVNVATAQRQPGSSFKPYVYVTAFKPEFKYSPATMLMDVVTKFGTFNGKDYIPHNYDGAEHGPVSMRTGLAGSLNIPAVKTLALVGVENAVQTARDLGITSPMADCGLSLVLGGCEVRLLDHVAAYSVIANGGVKNDKTFIMKIEDHNGKTLEEFKPDPKEVLDPEAAYELVSIMTDNNARSFVFGPNSPLILPDRVVAAKTGTTQDWKDGWTVGFTPSLAAGVWAGNDDGTLLKKGADGVLVAAPIWNQFMKEALKDTSKETFARPKGMQDIAVDAISGKLPTGNTPSTKNEIFASYNAPTDYDNVHVVAPVNSDTNLPADSSTPPEKIVYKPFTILHSEKPDNPDWENPVVTWATANGYTYPSGDVLNTPTPSQNPNENLQVNIQEPQENSVISENNFKITASVVAKNPVSKVEFFLDGQMLGAISTAPYVFQVSKTVANGTHTIAVKATDNLGTSSSVSVSTTFAQHVGLNLVEPGSDSLVVFPVSLKTESGKKLDKVEFYYQEGSSSPKLIGQADNTANFAGRYEYSFMWQDAPGSGSYQVFAKSDSLESNKVKITIP